MKWLEKELDEHQKDVVILCTHVPIHEPFTSPNHKMNNEYEIKSLLRKYSKPYCSSSRSLSLYKNKTRQQYRLYFNPVTCNLSKRF